MNRNDIEVGYEYAYCANPKHGRSVKPGGLWRNYAAYDFSHIVVKEKRDDSEKPILVEFIGDNSADRSRFVPANCVIAPWGTVRNEVFDHRARSANSTSKFNNLNFTFTVLKELFPSIGYATERPNLDVKDLINIVAMYRPDLYGRILANNAMTS